MSNPTEEEEEANKHRRSGNDSTEENNVIPNDHANDDRQQGGEQQCGGSTTTSRLDSSDHHDGSFQVDTIQLLVDDDHGATTATATTRALAASGTATSTAAPPPPFYDALHVSYVVALAERLEARTSYEGAVTEHLKMSGVYWSLSALSLLLPAERVNASSMQLQTKIVDWVFDCFDEKSGGFGGNAGQDGHLLYTLSALQILAMADRLDDARLNKPAVIRFCSSLQRADDGSFAGDAWGEVDTRFSYCALSALSILGALDRVDVDKAAKYIAACQNSVDGGFGAVIGAESHAGQVFCCIGALAIAQRLDLLLTKKAPSGSSSSASRRSSSSSRLDLLCWWLCERQVDSGGLNGRPEKQADVCYSWWILSSLSILGRVSWIARDKLAAFILRCQDPEDGGIADRPDDMPDVFHTFFGVAGLSLLGHLHEPAVLAKKKYRQVDPVYAIPADVVRRVGLRAQVLVEPDEAVDERLARYNALYYS